MAPGLLGHEGVVRLAERVSLAVDPALDAAFPARTPARVVVHAHGRRYAREVAHPQGDPANPMTAAALGEKFMRLAAPRLGTARAAALAETVEALGRGTSLEPLLALLRRDS